MKKIILILIFLLSLTIVSAEQLVYDLNLNSQNDSFSLINVSVDHLKKEFPVEFGSFRVELISFNDSILYSTGFDNYRTIMIDGIDPNTGIYGGREIILNKTEISLKIPYYDTAKSILIRHPSDEILLKIDVSQFSKDLCGDGTCQFYENVKSCRSDCAAPAANVTAVGKEKGIVETATQYVEENQTMVIGLIALVILIVIIVLISRKKPEPAEE